MAETAQSFGTCPDHGDPLVCLACEADEDMHQVWQREREAALQAALTAERERLIRVVTGLASWIRTPGNVDRDDAIDECARAVENLVAALRTESGEPR